MIRSYSPKLIVKACSSFIYFLKVIFFDPFLLIQNSLKLNTFRKLTTQHEAFKIFLNISKPTFGNINPVTY